MQKRRQRRPDLHPVGVVLLDLLVGKLEHLQQGGVRGVRGAGQGVEVHHLPAGKALLDITVCLAPPVPPQCRVLCKGSPVASKA